MLLSDGGDNASRTTKDEAVHKAQASNAVIYTIGLIEPDSRDANPGLLKELSLASGGESFDPDSDGIADVLTRSLATFVTPTRSAITLHEHRA